MALALDLSPSESGESDALTPTEDSKPDYKITFKPHADMFSKGHSVTRLISHLSELGDLEAICNVADIPAFDDIDISKSYLSWDISLFSTASEDEVREVFEFVIDDCELTIEAPSKSSALDAFLGAPPSGDIALPSLELPAIGAPTMELPNISAPEIALPVITPALDPLESTPISTPEPMAAAPQETAEPTPKAKITPKPTSAATKKAPPATIRINLERVDRLINQVGELVINQAMLTQCVTDAGLLRDPSVVSALDEFKQLTRDIQESVMAIMIRNAIDHGLETPEARIAKGKSPEGTVSLSAAHRSGKIAIEVSDDGAGINREKVRSIAVSKGLIAEDAELSKSEIDNLLFMPGFSTVDTVKAQPLQ